MHSRKLEELEHQNNMEASNLKMKWVISPLIEFDSYTVVLMSIAIRHAEQCHKLEQEREQYAAEWQAGQAQLHGLQKVLEEHQLLLADKVQK